MTLTSERSPRQRPYKCTRTVIDAESAVRFASERLKWPAVARNTLGKGVWLGELIHDWFPATLSGMSGPPPYSSPPNYPPPHLPTSGDALPYASYDLQRLTDDSHLNLLSIFHFVCGGILALFACMPFIHIFLGILIVSGQFAQTNAAPANPQVDRAFGYLFIVFGSAAVLIGWALAVCIILAGRAIRRRKWRMFTLVVAGINCMFMPVGTVLGVFTLIVLLRPSVAAQYAIANPARTD